MIFLLIFWVLPLFAQESFYPSGLLKSFEVEESVQRAPSRAPTETQIRDFIQKYFGALKNGEWKEIRRVSDKTHVHATYAYFHRGTLVSNSELKIHFNQNGYVEYADSNFKFKFSIDEPNPQTAVYKDKVSSWLKQRTQKKKIIYDADAPTIWMSEDGRKVRHAREVRVRTEAPAVIKHMIVDAATGEVLEERKVFRHANVYQINPDVAGLSNQVLNNLISAPNLMSNNVTVRREENSSSPALVHVDSTFDFSADGAFLADTSTDAYYLTTDPTGGFECNSGGSVTGCPNQSLDAVNIYYHIDSYRTALDGYLATLGSTLSFPNDPIQVIVNSLSIDFNGSGAGTDDTNNAAFVSSTCRTGVPMCLVFLRPTRLSGAAVTSICGASPARFLDLAREAIVAVHEYQHYVTHTITGFVGGGSTANVADALHEGFSDYLAASQITELSGSTVTQVGSYAFKNCLYFMRDLATVRVYTNGAAEEDSHVAGLSWASGLWYLRTQLGRTTTDLLALKSQFFMSSSPGFIEAVEALVKADKALNAGANVAMIRNLFYNTIKFVGGKSNIFRDPSNGIVEMGFRSCLASHRKEGAETEPTKSSYLLMGLLLLFVFFTFKKAFRHSS